MTKIKSLTNSKSASSKFNSNKMYSSFWMNDNDFYSGNNSRWAGLTGTGSSSSNTVKVIKLQSYRKAIANFVKILTKQDIPVYFAGDTSYTDFKKVVLGTDIKDTNFDVAVGLALHEASHLILTDREYLPKMMSDSNFRYSYLNNSLRSDDWKQLLNWIEDRRIDQYIFATSPGYKAYYHKMYDHYWNHEAITKGLESKQFRDPSLMESWMFRIVNSLNPAADVKALPRLGEVLQLIDTKSIKRLKSTAEAGEVAAQVLDIILSFMAQPQSQTPEPEEDENGQGQPTNDGKKDDKKDQEEEQDPQDNNDDEFGDDETQGGEGDDEQDGQGEDSSDDAEEEKEEQGKGAQGQGEEEEAKPEPKALTGKEQQELKQAMQKQKEFLNGDIKKEKGAQALTNQLKAASSTTAELQQVGEGSIANSCIVYDLTKDSVLMEIADIYETIAKSGNSRGSKANKEMDERLDALEDRLPKNFANRSYSPSSFKIYEGPEGHEENAATAIQRGLEMGALLGRKMQIRSESRELVTNRMNTGHIDNKRLAQAGFGIENIFKQITVDNYKKANLHISLDASGSMGGIKWNNTIMMTTAICKAISMIQNLEVQVSLRITDGNNPVVATVYDSRKNKLRQLTSAFTVASTSYMTPEGLCFDAQIRKNLLVPGSKEVDSYFLNLSDGAPGGCGNYYGPKAVQHTKKQVELMRQMDIKILGFFMTEGDHTSNLTEFRTMYGAKDSKQVKASDAMQIAKAMNELFMSKN